MTPTEATKLMQDNLAHTVNKLKDALDSCLPDAYQEIEIRVTAAYLHGRHDRIAALERALFNKLADDLERAAKRIRK